MAGESTDEKVRRGAGRTLANLTLAVVVPAALIAWASTGFYQLRQAGGEAALILRFGAYRGTESRPGWHWHLPPPIEVHEIVRTGELQSEEFGAKAAPDGETLRGDIAMQTRDNNIVNLSFAVQYRRQEAFEVRYMVADPDATLRSAAEAAVREAVGRTGIDDALSEGRGEVQEEARRLLEETLARYGAGIEIEGMLLREVAPPAEVREAFDDVIAAAQDEQRKMQEAEGYRNEVIPRARGEAIELERAAEGYRDATVAEAAGEAARFSALLTEYRKAPEVTRRRLYLEAMEEVLPRVHKLIIEPGTAAMLPYYLPSGDASRGAAREELPRP